jgi:hypothetical protein
MAFGNGTVKGVHGLAEPLTMTFAVPPYVVGGDTTPCLVVPCTPPLSLYTNPSLGPAPVLVHLCSSANLAEFQCVTWDGTTWSQAGLAVIGFQLVNGQPVAICASTHLSVRAFANTCRGQLVGSQD